MSAYVGDKLIRTWEDDHEADRTYLHQCVTLFWNSYMYFQYFCDHGFANTCQWHHKSIDF